MLRYGVTAFSTLLLLTACSCSNITTEENNNNRSINARDGVTPSPHLVYLSSEISMSRVGFGSCGLGGNTAKVIDR